MRTYSGHSTPPRCVLCTGSNSCSIHHRLVDQRYNNNNALNATTAPRAIAKHSRLVRQIPRAGDDACDTNCKLANGALDDACGDAMRTHAAPATTRGPCCSVNRCPTPECTPSIRLPWRPRHFICWVWPCGARRRLQPGAGPHLRTLHVPPLHCTALSVLRFVA